MKNEISREHQATPYRESEMTIPLFMRPKVQYSRQTYLDWISILGNLIGHGKMSAIRERAFID